MMKEYLQYSIFPLGRRAENRRLDDPHQASKAVVIPAGNDP
jgi:hypothetical protein